MMERVDLDRGTAELEDLVDRAEAGETIELVRHGKVVARLVAVEPRRKPIDREWLRNLTEGQAVSETSAADLVRALRDGERY